MRPAVSKIGINKTSQQSSTFESQTFWLFIQTQGASRVSSLSLGRLLNGPQRISTGYPLSGHSVSIVRRTFPVHENTQPIFIGKSENQYANRIYIVPERETGLKRKHGLSQTAPRFFPGESRCRRFGRGWVSPVESRNDGEPGRSLMPVRIGEHTSR